jgi:hypothetical protein
VTVINLTEGSVCLIYVVRVIYEISLIVYESLRILRNVVRRSKAED